MSTITRKEARFLKVPLTNDEIRERGEQLADLVRDLGEIEERQTGEKKHMKEEVEGVEGRIRHVAAIVTAGVEERSVQVEIRANLALALVEEVRTDTGEVVTTRSATQEDKIRAQAQQQTGLPGIAPEPGQPA